MLSKQWLQQNLRLQLPIQFLSETVKIDGKGIALVKQQVCRDGAVMYIVQVCGCDFDVDIDAKRVQTVTADSDSETKQTTGSSCRFKIVTDQEVNDFNIKLTKTVSDLRIFQAFCNEPEISEHRKIQDIPVKELYENETVATRAGRP